MKWLALAAVAAATTGALAAQAPAVPIITDRPDFTESSSLVPAHRLQFESGYTWTEASRTSGGGGSGTWPELLVRYGLSHRLELRLGESFTSISPPVGQGRPFTARDDLYLGMKVALGAQRKSRPQFAILAQATLPTGDSRTTANTTLPGLGLLAGWVFSPQWSLDLGVEVNRVQGDAWELAPSASLSYSFSARVGGFTEWYGLIPLLSESGAATPHHADAGLFLLLSPDLQLDARVGAGFNDAADRYFFGFGFAIRR